MKKGTIFTRKGIQRSCSVKNTGVFTPPTSADNELARKGLAVAGSLRQYDGIGRVAAGELFLAEHISVEVDVEGVAAGVGLQQIGGAGDESAEALEGLGGVIAAAGQQSD